MLFWLKEIPPVSNLIPLPTKALCVLLLQENTQEKPYDPEPQIPWKLQETFAFLPTFSSSKTKLEFSIEVSANLEQFAEDHLESDH